MKILAIDYGRRNIGLAISSGRFLVRPLGTIRVSKMRDAVNKISEICQKEKVEKIVLGISKGAMEEEIKQFGKLLTELYDAELVFWDETLSSKEARKLLITLGKSKKKREKEEHAFSAAMILDSYIWEKGEEK